MKDGRGRAVFLDRDGVINVRLPDGAYVTGQNLVGEYLGCRPKLDAIWRAIFVYEFLCKIRLIEQLGGV